MLQSFETNGALFGMKSSLEENICVKKRYIF